MPQATLTDALPPLACEVTCTCPYASGHIDSCPYNVCNDVSKNTTFWGWANSVFAWDAVKKGLSAVDGRGLLYTLAPDSNAANQSYLAMTDPVSHMGTGLNPVSDGGIHGRRTL